MHILAIARKRPANPEAKSGRRGFAPNALRNCGVILAMAVVVLLPACTSGEAAICSGRVVAKNQAAPQAQGPAVAGEGSVSLGELRGNVVVVNFWASWCGPCRTETPMLSQAARDLESQGVRFMGVNIRDDKASAAAFEREFEVPFRSVYDREASIAAAWNVAAPPATYAVSGEGRIVAAIPGPIDRTDLSCMIEYARAPRGEGT